MDVLAEASSDGLLDTANVLGIIERTKSRYPVGSFVSIKKFGDNILNYPKGNSRKDLQGEKFLVGLGKNFGNPSILA